MILVLKRKNLMLTAIATVLTIAILGVNVNLGGKNVDVSNDPSLNFVPTTVNVSGEGKTIVLDAGHGGEDPGATSKFSDLKEKDLNLKLALKTKDLFEKAGYKVIMTRTEDVLKYEGDSISMTAKRKMDLLLRKKTMDESQADIVVSIHLNGFGDAKYFGAQAFFTKTSKSSQKLAILMQKALQEKVDPANKREALLKKDDIIITKNCKVTTVVVECGFLTNEAEEKNLRDEAYQNKLCEAIKYGVDMYFSPTTTENAAPLGNSTKPQ